MHQRAKQTKKRIVPSESPQTLLLLWIPPVLSHHLCPQFSVISLSFLIKTPHLFPSLSVCLSVCPSSVGCSAVHQGQRCDQASIHGEAEGGPPGPGAGGQLPPVLGGHGLHQRRLGQQVLPVSRRQKRLFYGFWWYNVPSYWLNSQLYIIVSRWATFSIPHNAREQAKTLSYSCSYAFFEV